MHQNKDDNFREMLREENLQKFKNTIVVMSGKGGVGKSTVAVNLAYAISLTGKTAGIMDIDFHGPSIPKMTGIENKKMTEISKDGRPMPIKVVNNLYVLSIASLMENPDASIIWRGPMKMGVINQFLEDINWPELDYLIIDCPPGTGDEPLSIIQAIKDVTGVIIVSTPQDVAFLDARKSIDFVNKLNVPILGIVENMAGFICPKCGEKIDIFKSGGALKAASDFNVEILGSIPLEPDIVNAGDEGKPYVYFYSKTQGGKAFMEIAEKILLKTENRNSVSADDSKKDNNKIAIPVENDKLCEHFGHAPEFFIYELNNNKIIKKEKMTPPPHEPGTIPKWLNSLGVTVLLAGGIGQGAIDYFNNFNIEVISGCPAIKHSELIKHFMNEELESKNSVCDHNHDHNCH